jgi:ribonuclease HII
MGSLSKKEYIKLIDFDEKLAKEGEIIVGIDEAGRGSLFGPVVAAAVAFKIPEPPIEWVNDSKKITEKRREEVYKLIKERSLKYSIGIRNSFYIDKYDIYHSTRMAMIQAVNSLKIKANVYIFDYMKFTGLDARVYALKKADAKSYAVACASIIAKVTRDNIIKKMQAFAPEFSLSKHKGYGTKKHIEELEKFGPSKYHRITFKRVKK